MNPKIYSKFVEARNQQQAQQTQQTNNNNKEEKKDGNLLQKAGNWIGDKVEGAKNAAGEWVSDKVDDVKNAAVQKVVEPLKGTLEKAVGAGVVAAPFAYSLYKEITGMLDGNENSNEDNDGDGKVDNQMVQQLQNQIDTQFSTDIKVLYNKAKNTKSDYAQKVLTQLQPLVNSNTD